MNFVHLCIGSVLISYLYGQTTNAPTPTIDFNLQVFVSKCDDWSNTLPPDSRVVLVFSWNETVPLVEDAIAISVDLENEEWNEINSEFGIIEYPAAWNGEWHALTSTAGFGELLTAQVFIDNSDGFCLKELVVSYGDSSVYSLSDQLGNGVVISSECYKPFLSLNGFKQSILYQCLPSILLKTNEKPRVYDIAMHTCIPEDSGIAVANMDQLTMTIATYNDVSFTTSNPIALTATNRQPLTLAVTDFNTATDSFVSPRTATATAIAVVFKADSSQSFSSAVFLDDGASKQLGTQMQVEDYYVIMFNPNLDINTASEYKLTLSTDSTGNVYFIFDDNVNLPFKFVNEVGTWSDANENKCEDGLASIHSELENEIAFAMSSGYATWIGLNDIDNEDDWVWSDGTPFDYYVWGPGQPDNWQSGEDCVHLNTGNPTFNDRPCTKNLRAICANNPIWRADQTRTYQVILPNELELGSDVSMVTVQNTGSDDLCIDSISANGVPLVMESDIASDGSNAVFQFPYASDLVKVFVRKCDDWSNTLPMDSMVMKLTGTESSTEYFTVNLESDGWTEIDDLAFNTAAFGDLLTAQVFFKNRDGFCLKDLFISYGDSNSYAWYNQLGNGVIISPKCIHSFQSLSSSKPLFQCAPELELTTYKTPRVFDIAMHTCIMEDSGITLEEMGELTMTITTKNEETDTFETSDPIALDSIDYRPLDITQVLTLAASNFNTETDYLYSPEAGKAIAIVFKAESSQTFSSGSTFKAVGGTGVPLNDEVPVGDYHIIPFKPYADINTASMYELTLSPASTGEVYFIFEENENLPFELFEDGAGIWSGTWSDANENCDYGLASIHSEVDNAIAFAMSAGYNAWIGLSDRKNEGAWVWNDGSPFDYNSWGPDQPNDHGSGQDCVALFAGYAPWAGLPNNWNDAECHEKFGAICDNQIWRTDQTRTYQVIFPDGQGLGTDVSVITIQNTDINANAMCIDSVSANGMSAKSVLGNEIDNGAMLVAVFDWPVCDMEITDVQLVFADTASQTDINDLSILTAECKNYNKFISSECSIAQSISLSTESTLEFSTETSEEDSYSTESSTSLSMGSSVSQSIGVSLSTEAGVGPVTLGSEVSFGAEFGATVDREWSDTKAFSRSSSSSNVESSAFTHSDENTLECSGSSSVPPLHSLQYSLTLSQIQMKVTTLTDLKLTLCSALIDGGDSENGNHYIYLNDIEGSLGVTGGTSCVVSFSKVIPTLSSFKCGDEQVLSAMTDATYMPECYHDGTEWLYEDCQCQLGQDQPICYCVDAKTGTIKDGTVQVVDGAYSDREAACADPDMECVASQSAKSVDNNILEDLGDLDDINDNDNDVKPVIVNNNFEIPETLSYLVSAMIVTIIIGVLMCIIGVFMWIIEKVSGCVHNQKEHQYVPVKMDMTDQDIAV